MKNSLRQNKSFGIVVSVIAYLVALTAAIIVGRYYREYDPLMMLAVADITATVVIFIFSVLLNNSSMYDPYWSLKPMVIAFFYFLTYDTGINTTRQYIVLVLILLYGLRLTLNFYRDWKGLGHEDWRYVNFRKDNPRSYWIVSFIGIHFFPTIMVFLGCLPMSGAMGQGSNPLNLLDLVGVFIMVAAISLAFVADEQLRIFRKNPVSMGKTMRDGLWKFSRHPNYLGEISTWWGLYVFALASGTKFWWTGIGALTITLMFLFISIPMMERRSLQRRSDYAEYISSTSSLVPMKLKI